jgi:UDP-glucose 4-epimerase
VEGVDYRFPPGRLVSVPESMAKPGECVDINVHGLLNVLEEASAAGVKKLVFASSAASMATTRRCRKLETDAARAEEPVCHHQARRRILSRHVPARGRLETAAIRFFNVFGPRQDPKGAYAAAVPIFIEKALQGRGHHHHGDGEQTRDFIYVKDIVGALSFAVETPGVTGVFNAGYGGQITINELADDTRSGTTERTNGKGIFGRIGSKA